MSIYLIQKREHVNRAEPIYKIGCSTQLKVRNRSGSDIHLILPTLYANRERIEKLIKAELNRRFVHRHDCGPEYYEGDLQAMIDTMVGIWQRETVVAQETDSDSESYYTAEEPDEAPIYKPRRYRNSAAQFVTETVVRRHGSFYPADLVACAYLTYCHWHGLRATDDGQLTAELRNAGFDYGVEDDEPGYYDLEIAAHYYHYV